MRYHALDALKAMCALLVVFIHCSYSYKAAVLPLTDVAVPLFFAISGYFVYQGGRSKQRIRRIVNIIAWSFALYLLKTELWWSFLYGTPFIPTIKNFIDLFVFNDVVFAIHLWYLPAYLYVLVIAYIVDKFSLWEKAWAVSIPLLLIGTCVRWNYPTDIQYFRNFLFVGFPYFMLGSYINSRISVTSMGG